MLPVYYMSMRGEWYRRARDLLDPPYLPRAHEVGLDWRVFVFMLGVCAVVGTALGAVPAAIAARRDPRATLQEGGVPTTASAFLSTRWSKRRRRRPLPSSLTGQRG